MVIFFLLFVSKFSPNCIFIYCSVLFFFSLVVVVHFVWIPLANLCTIGYSLSVGWMATAVLLYDSDDCPLPSGRISMDDIASICSIIGIGGLVGTILVGWMADQFGRKNALLAMVVPQIVGFSFPFVFV